MAFVEEEKPRKLNQAEMLEKMSPAPFDQRRRVPEGAQKNKSPENRWWRTDSPRGDDDDPEDCALREVDKNPPTRGVLGHGKRSGPGCFQTQHQVGVGSHAAFR